MRQVRYRGWRLEQETQEADRVRVRLRFDSEEEAVHFALTWGGEAEIVEPRELRYKLLAGALAVMQRYQV
jgi:predicted DNA-binding transcriptional regulator YafY